VKMTDHRNPGQWKCRTWKLRTWNCRTISCSVSPQSFFRSNHGLTVHI